MPDPLGPVSTLPGSILGPPEGTACEICGEPATQRVQGETDSFGAEWNDLCDSCAREDLANSGPCDWCGKDVERRTHTRDYDEGLSGRVYLVCDPCLRNYTDRIVREEDEARGRFG
jgi:hypothetical protein